MDGGPQRCLGDWTAAIFGPDQGGDGRGISKRPGAGEPLTDFLTSAALSLSAIPHQRRDRRTTSTEPTTMAGKKKGKGKRGC